MGVLLSPGAGLQSWRIWRRTNLPEYEVSSGIMPNVAFWALGGMLVSAFCLAAIPYTGGLVVVLSTGCPRDWRGPSIILLVAVARHHDRRATCR